MSVRRSLPAGILDSGMASLATFIVGVYAVRVLDPVSLGAYALFFAGFSTLTVIPAQLVFHPAEILAARRSGPERIGTLLQSLWLGLIPVVGAVLVIPALLLTVPREVSTAASIPLLLSALPCTAISPVQDHVRAMLHIGGRSWEAAIASGVQVVGVIAMLLLLTRLGVPVIWHPFAALGAANFVSSAAGLVLWSRVRKARPTETLVLGDLIRSGRWLLLAGLSPGVTGFGAAWLVAHLAGVTTLGYAEGARVLARPIAVIGLGMKAIIGPRLMRAGAERDIAGARRLARLYSSVVGLCGLAYLLLAGFRWRGNPFVDLLPNAYVVAGLAAASIAVFTLDRVAGAGASWQLLGAARERSVGMVEMASSVGRIIGGLTAPVTGAFAMPLGYLIMSAVRKSALNILVARLYREPTSRLAPAP